MALAPPDELPGVRLPRRGSTRRPADTHPDFTIDKLTTDRRRQRRHRDREARRVGHDGTRERQGTWQVGGTCRSPTGRSLRRPPRPASGAAEGSPSDSVDRATAGHRADLPRRRSRQRGAVRASITGIDSADDPASGSVSIEVVRENGRWFVSPVTTALNVVDATIEHIDERTVYSCSVSRTSCRPTARSRSAKPFTIPASRGTFSPSVYRVRGHEGSEARRRDRDEGEVRVRVRARSTRLTARTSTTSTSRTRRAARVLR